MALLVMERLRVVWTLIAVASSISAAQAPAIDDFYCERSYTNFATGYQHHGTYVDGQGRVFAFGSDTANPGAVKPWNPKQPEAPTKELGEKVSHQRRQVGSVDARALADVRRWLDEARRGVLSKKVQRGADMGTRASACWVRETGTDRYRQVELDVSGDWAYTNTSAAAAHLERWLATVAPKR